MQLIKWYVVATLVAMSPTANVMAQPPVNQTPAGANSANQAQPNEKQLQKQRERADRETLQKEWPRQVLRDFMTRNGFTDKDLQETVLAHVEQHQQRSQKVRESGNKLQTLMAQAGVPPTQIALAINEYKAALEDYTAGNQAADLALDAKINYSKDARLEATLLLSGVFDQGPSFVNAGAPPWAGGGKNGNGKSGGKAQAQNAP